MILLQVHITTSQTLRSMKYGIPLPAPIEQTTCFASNLSVPEAILKLSEYETQYNLSNKHMHIKIQLTGIQNTPYLASDVLEAGRIRLIEDVVAYENETASQQ